MVKVAKELWYRETRNFAIFGRVSWQSSLSNDSLKPTNHQCLFHIAEDIFGKQFSALDVATQIPTLEIQIRKNENDYRNYCEFANLFTPNHDFAPPFNLQLESPLGRAAIRSTFVSQCNHEVDKCCSEDSKLLLVLLRRHCRYVVIASDRDENRSSILIRERLASRYELRDWHD